MRHDYYNEIDPFAAAWLRALIAEGCIPDGEVDERDIRDVEPVDLLGFGRCHFFAGIGGWAHALRLADWPEDRPVWTGSCPCQPFSQAGRGSGFADERHLWPHWFPLVDVCRPHTILGEQVASKDGLGWFDLVSSDLEGAGYAVGAVDLCAAGVGAPHIRQRLWWGGRLADAERGPAERHGLAVGAAPGGVPSEAWKQRVRPNPRDGVAVGSVADASSSGRDEQRRQLRGETSQRQRRHQPHDRGVLSGLADASPERRDGQRLRLQPGRQDEAGAETAGDGCAGVALGDTSGAGLAQRSEPEVERRPLRIEGAAFGEAEPVRGFWRGADWIWCRDGKYRPVEPGTFPLAHGLPGRVGRLRGYGNAIVPEAAAEFVRAWLEIA